MNENKFEHSGQIPIGCNSGDHLWDEREGKIGIEADGDLTKIKTRCIRCGQQFDMSVPLDLNQFIEGSSVAPQPQRNYSMPTQQTQQIQHNEEDTDRSDILRRLLG